jgi:hypothetical protein
VAKRLNFLTSTHKLKGNKNMNTLTNAVETSATNKVVLNDKQKKARKATIAATSTKLLYAMEESRITWEEGAYRTSNQALYQVLAQCLQFCGELSIGDAKARLVSLEKFYKSRNYKYNKTKPLITRVIRAVFGDVDRRRLSTYSIVLRKAQKLNVPYSELAGCIEKEGGVQEIKLGQSETFISMADKAEMAKEHFDSMKPLGTVNSEMLSLTADADFMGDTCVLLAEQNSQGGFDIKVVIRNASVVKAAFAAMYSKQQEVTAEAKRVVDAANDAEAKLAKAA